MRLLPLRDRARHCTLPVSLMGPLNALPPRWARLGTGNAHEDRGPAGRMRTPVCRRSSGRAGEGRGRGGVPGLRVRKGGLERRLRAVGKAVGEREPGGCRAVAGRLPGGCRAVGNGRRRLGGGGREVSPERGVRSRRSCSLPSSIPFPSEGVPPEPPDGPCSTAPRRDHAEEGNGPRRGPGAFRRSPPNRRPRGGGGGSSTTSPSTTSLAAPSPRARGLSGGGVPTGTRSPWVTPGPSAPSAPSAPAPCAWGSQGPWHTRPL